MGEWLYGHRSEEDDDRTLLSGVILVVVRSGRNVPVHNGQGTPRPDHRGVPAYGAGRYAFLMWLLFCCATATRRNCPSALSRPRHRLAPVPLARQGLCCPKVAAPSSMDTRPAVLLSLWPSGALRVVLGNSRFLLVLDGRGRGLLPRFPVDARRRICTVTTQLPNRGLWLARTALQKLRHLGIRSHPPIASQLPISSIVSQLL